MGKVKANAIVARGKDQYNETEINAFINLFTYAQQFFSRKDEEEFRYLKKKSKKRRIYNNASCNDFYFFAACLCQFLRTATSYFKMPLNSYA